MKFLRKLFSRRWVVATLLVLGAIAVTIRLGIWQLDRLEQRKAFNERVLEQINQPVLSLKGDALELDLHNMEYRSVLVKGEYDFSQQIAIHNQIWNNQYGVHLVTPLRIEGTDQYILVDRGWIPAEDFENGDLSKYAEPGRVQVAGVIRRTKEKADLGGRTDPTPVPDGSALKIWNFVNIGAISRQVPYTLLPVYIQQAPDPTWKGFPKRSEPDLEITEGPHFGYAMQWFAFAATLAAGYPFFIRRQETRPQQVHYYD